MRGTFMLSIFDVSIQRTLALMHASRMQRCGIEHDSGARFIFRTRVREFLPQVLFYKKELKLFV